LDDDEFKAALHNLFDSQLGPLYVNPRFVARLRKVFRASYDPAPNITKHRLASLALQSFVGTLYGADLYQTPDIPDGWVYAPPGGDHNVLHGGAADRQYMHQLDPTALPYTPPPPRRSRYDRLMDR